MKYITTLVKDIEDVLQAKGGWDAVARDYLTKNIGEAADRRFSLKTTPRTKGLRMSNIGSPCKRKLWYYVNLPDGTEEEVSPSMSLKYFYGDIIESLVLSLAKAAGHTVEGEQDEVSVEGIKGHRDCIIDGVLIDVKSASTKGFEKFKYHMLNTDDPFGYLPQITGYLAGAQSDPKVTEKNKAGFLAVDKTLGHICLDMYDLRDEVKDFPSTIRKTIDTVTNLSVTPKKAYSDVPDGKSGNMKLDTACSYCEYKSLCWTGLRQFNYSTGPRWLTKVVREPNIKGGESC
jgi:CRISPR/Cas system-associated exonuclease Cas4 (RecB family)